MNPNVHRFFFVRQRYRFGPQALTYRMSPPSDSIQLRYFCDLSLVYGRYNELVDYGIHGLNLNQLNWKVSSCKNPRNLSLLKFIK